MFEVVRDWNYATAIICTESAFIFRDTAARAASMPAESAFFVDREKIFC
ncbi:MAG TPA: hypothetical protein VJ299_10755 [Steroidobacteraceae bacterium]|jgi:hypothetical protein|nr:hypothetical protein [Steroidobacteraceae bacterium]HJY42557.1 hypothetical protein [Steroidobacteraceae bacterium]